MRKQFTPSERVAIMQTLELKKVGNPDYCYLSNNSRILGTEDAAKSVGFANRGTYYRAHTNNCYPGNSYRIMGTAAAAVAPPSGNCSVRNSYGILGTEDAAKSPTRSIVP
jgi:hypothetical protein